LFIIGIKYIVNSNVLEMIRKMELVKVGDELYEIVKKLPIQRFTKEVAGESADTLKQYYGVEKILKFNQTMEYLFVNKIEDLEIIS
jgi:propanediol dehydratase small subunit